MGEVYDLAGRREKVKPQEQLKFQVCPVCGDEEWLVVVNKKKTLERLICADYDCEGYVELKPIDI